jgi:hypothetical protein
MLPVGRNGGDVEQHRSNSVAVNILLLVLGSALSGTVSAQQSQLPNDADLKTAYCIPVAEFGVNFIKQILANAAASQQRPTPEQQQTIDRYRGNLQEQEAVLDRLRKYLVPRILYLDPFALTAAQQRGQADVAVLQAASENQAQSDCLLQCASKQQGSGAQIDQNECVKQCSPPTVVSTRERIGSCATPTWLPF